MHISGVLINRTNVSVLSWLWHEFRAPMVTYFMEENEMQKSYSLRENTTPDVSKMWRKMHEMLLTIVISGHRRSFDSLWGA